MVNSPLTSIGSPFVAWSGVGIQDFASDSCVRRTTQRPRNGVVEAKGCSGRMVGKPEVNRLLPHRLSLGRNYFALGDSTGMGEMKLTAGTGLYGGPEKRRRTGAVLSYS